MGSSRKRIFPSGSGTVLLALHLLFIGSSINLSESKKQGGKLVVLLSDNRGPFWTATISGIGLKEIRDLLSSRTLRSEALSSLQGQIGGGVKGKIHLEKFVERGEQQAEESRQVRRTVKKLPPREEPVDDRIEREALEEEEQLKTFESPTIGGGVTAEKFTAADARSSKYQDFDVPNQRRKFKVEMFGDQDEAVAARRSEEEEAEGMDPPLNNRDIASGGFGIYEMSPLGSDTLPPRFQRFQSPVVEKAAMQLEELASQETRFADERTDHQQPEQHEYQQSPGVQEFERRVLVDSEPYRSFDGYDRFRPEEGLQYPNTYASYDDMVVPETWMDSRRHRAREIDGYGARNHHKRHHHHLHKIMKRYPGEAPQYLSYGGAKDSYPLQYSHHHHQVPLVKNYPVAVNKNHKVVIQEKVAAGHKNIPKVPKTFVIRVPKPYSVYIRKS